MISQDEIHKLAIDHGVPIAQIEKDYVMGWLLWGIYRNQFLQRNLVLKGGNCLRKVYFPNTRFSDDLDFTALHLDAEDRFRSLLLSVCKDTSKASGIPFEIEQTKVELKDTPHETLKALDSRIYFRGFAGDSSVTMRIKLDVSEFERIVLPIQQHKILHPYSDANKCNAVVYSYSLEEVLAEKLRSWIQRTRSRDLFDAVSIIQSKAVPISKLNILKTFMTKTLYKGIPTVAKEELLADEKFQVVESHWNGSIVCPANAMLIATEPTSVFHPLRT